MRLIALALLPFAALLEGEAAREDAAWLASCIEGNDD